jgi:glycosyltransferase involved in cell wall biosynthesis
MGKAFVSLFISLILLISFHIVFFIINMYFWIIDGYQVLFHGGTLIENLYYSIYLKWMLLLDALWILSIFVYAFRRKSYKTNPQLHYLETKPKIDPNVCVIIPTFNEEKIIQNMLNEFSSQPYVKNIIVVDNNSSDNTVNLAKQSGAIVIEKKINKGYTDSCIVGFRESLKTNSNIISLIDADGTFSPNDLKKMIPYLENCDLVLGTRQVQTLTEKGNQNSMFYVWGNMLLAKLLQLKYFSLLHLGIVQLTDVGCSYRCIRKDALEIIIDELTNPIDSSILNPKNWLFSLYMTMLSIENDLKIVEIPLTFKKRNVGESKSEVTKKSKGIVYGMKFLWFILKR